MAQTFPFSLVSPERNLISADIREAIIPGSEGEFTIMAQHAPFLANLRPGFLSLIDDKSEKKDFVVLGGFADANSEGLTVLAEEAYPREGLDKKVLDDALEGLEKQLEHIQDDVEQSVLKMRISDVKGLIAAL